MKKLIISSILMVLLAAGTSIVAQETKEDYLGLPGDNLNLYAVMKLFRESKTLEEFENGLNDQKNNINNLDLNGDNYVDYIRVMDNVDGDVHNIVLQIAVSERENQDVAVFTVQRLSNGQVQIQLVGDEELYGKNYIIEPIFDEQNQTPNPGYTGNTETVYGRNVTVVRTTTYELAAWPVVRYIYLPTYSIWRSSWYWGYYPSFWRPWTPYYWHYYYGYHYNWYDDYYGHYRRYHIHRYDRWNDFYYTSRRSYSPYVSVRIQGGNYKTTYSRPEQRRDGEKLFSEKHPEQSRRTAPTSTVNSSARRTDSRSTQTGSTTVNSRRVSATTAGRTNANQSSGQNAVTTRRSTIVSGSPDRKTVSDQNAGTTRRTTTVSNNSVPKTVSRQTAEPARRTTTVSNRTNTTPSSGRTVSSSRTSGASKSTSVSTTSRRSTTVKKADTSVKKSDSGKTSEVKKDSRRK
jgi:hypothetical protein